MDHIPQEGEGLPFAKSPMWGRRSPSERILLVDDQPSWLNRMREGLENAGYAVVTAKDGNSAYNIYRDDWDGFNLVITDRNMPNGWGHPHP